MAQAGEGLRKRVERRWQAGRAAGGLTGCVLAPAAGLFRLAARCYHGAYDRGLLQAWRAPVPVLSVGNITVGGTGKTPFTRWLVERLLALGARPGVLHGGYADDEPLLHRSWHPEVPVVAGKDRRASAIDAIDRGADILVLDDAFQHRAVARDVDIVLVAAEAWTGAAPMLPRGPWREPLRALSRADVLVVTRRSADEAAAREVARALAGITGGQPLARVYLAPTGWLAADGSARAGRPAECVAVVAVAQPRAFAEQATTLGAQIADVLEFADHHRYAPDDVAHILRVARGRPLVTTAKDAVKLQDLVDPEVMWVLDQQVVVEEGEEVLNEVLIGIAP